MSESVSGKRYLKREDVDSVVIIAKSESQLTEAQTREMLSLVGSLVGLLPDSEQEIVGVKELGSALATLYFRESSSLRPRDVEVMLRLFSVLNSYVAE